MEREKMIEKIQVMQAGLALFQQELTNIKRELQSGCINTEPALDEKLAAVVAQVKVTHAARISKKVKAA